MELTWILLTRADLQRGRTTVVVAHRLLTVTEADQIAGRIFCIAMPYSTGFYVHISSTRALCSRDLSCSWNKVKLAFRSYCAWRSCRVGETPWAYQYPRCVSTIYIWTGLLGFEREYLNTWMSPLFVDGRYARMWSRQHSFSEEEPNDQIVTVETKVQTEI